VNFDFVNEFLTLAEREQNSENQGRWIFLGMLEKYRNGGVNKRRF
jgi:hypothetical protein